MSINVSPDQEVGVRSIGPIASEEIEKSIVRRELVLQHIPTVQKHLGHSDPIETQILLNLIFFGFNGEEFEEALEKFVGDLLQNNPEALAVSEAGNEIISLEARKKEIYHQQFSRICKEIGETVRISTKYDSALGYDVEFEDIESHESFLAVFDEEKYEEIDGLVTKTQEFRLITGDVFLSYEKRRMVFKVWADLYWPGHIKSTVHNTPEELNEALTLLPNNSADRDFHYGLRLLPRSWGRNEEKVTRYFNGKEGHVVEYQPSEIEKTLGDAPERALTALDERFAKIKSEAVADVIDILFHHWHTTKNRETNAAIINAAKICEYRNKTLSGENLELHWHALQDAFSFVLRETSSDLKARIFFSESQGESTQGPGAKYIYSPGFMLQYALKDQPLYFAPFLQKVWALDPVRENEAKRLARYLRADWRMNTQDYLTAEGGGVRAARWHTWAFLLAEAGIDVESIKKKANRNRLIETIARAVETLYQMEVTAEGGFDIYHPSDRDAAENLPARGALDTWLALRVCLAPSAALREALLETDGKRRAGRQRDAKALATERAKKQLRTQRKAKPESPNK